MTTKQALQYTARTPHSDGTVFDHFGTVEGARRKARKYARDAFPAWTYANYGPLIVVSDATTGEVLLSERM